MKFTLPFLVMLVITGCSLSSKPSPTQTITIEQEQIQEPHTSNSLNTIIVDIADQLFATNDDNLNPPHLILTSFVDLNQLDQTNTFGRLLSESMFNELHIRKFKVTDFRGQDAVSVNEDGEFHITRDVSKLKDSLEEIEYILVGTYVKFENQSLLINARILDSISGDVISSARVVYRPKDCKLFNLCEQTTIVTPTSFMVDDKQDGGIDIVSDDCRDNNKGIQCTN